MASLNEIIHTARSRKIFHTAAIYLSSSVTILGVSNLFSNHFHWSPKIFDCLLVVLICGFPASLIFTWAHAPSGKQKFSRVEMVAYAILLVIAVLFSIRIIGTPSGLSRGPFEERSIAVLPFQNLSDSKEDEFFSDGVTEDIIAQLAKIGDLKVISRTSVMSYKNTPKQIPVIGKELNVANILEGSVRREGDRVRIIGRLIDAANDKNLWTETYNRPMTDILAIQSEVAQKIAAELRARLSPDEKQRIQKKATASAAAYAYYVRGRDYYYKYARDDNEKAIELFKKALELDPNYALAYAGLGDAYSWHWRFEGAEESLDTALAMSRKAIELDPELAEGYKALGLAQEWKGLTDDGLKSYLTAVGLNPNYAPVVANIGSIYFSRGKYDEALKWLRRTVELQPGFARYYALIGLQYHSLEFDDLARAWAERALEFQPDSAFAQLVLISVDICAGQMNRARERVKKILTSQPENPDALNAQGDIDLLSGDLEQARQSYQKLADLTSSLGPPGNKLAYIMLKSGDRAAAMKIIEQNLHAYLERSDLDKEGSPIRYYIAELYALKDEKEDALNWLEKSLEIGYNDRWIFIDPLLQKIRALPRFQSIMNRQEEKLAAMRQRVKELSLDR